MDQFENQPIYRDNRFKVRFRILAAFATGDNFFSDFK